MASTALAPGLARKLKKVLETRTDSPDLLESLNTLSAFHTENTPQARRNLRAMIEKRGLSLNDEFLRASENAQKALDAVESEVAVLAESCDRIAKAMNSCASVTGDFMAVTEKLKHDLESSNQRLEIVTNFLHNYQLTTEEISALREDDLNEKFFKALARVQEIHANCKVLLRTHHQRAGLEMMDMMAVYQEGAYERLCRWVQAECRFLSDSDQPEVRELLKTASRCLKERPVLFKYCAEEVANTRHNALFRRFISALTRGGPGGMPRPIEVHAHDPLRYVGDMLGWLHQALASERELAISLFNPDAVANPKSQLSAKEDKQDVKAETDLTFVLDRVFEGVCRPFKVRVEQVLQSQPGILLAYKLTILLEFYSHTISELLGESSALSVTLKDVRDAAERTFFDTIKARGDKLLRYLPPVPADLSPPPAVAEGVSVLLELIVTYNSMMVPAGGIKPEFEPVMAAMLGPVMEMCERAAETYASKSTVRKSISLDTGRTRKSAENVVTANGVSHHGYNLLAEIFLTNCLYAIQQPLLTKDIGTKFVKALKESIDRHIETMVDHKISAFLERCGLLRKIEFIKKRASQTPVSEIVSKDRAADFDKPIVQVEEMNPVAVSESLRVFFGLLASEDALPEFEQLQDPSLRSEVCNRFGIALADAYELLYNTLLDPLNHYSDARTMLRHTPEQIKTILGV